MSKAIVTLCIGEPYKAQWTERFAPTWRRYAERHGYDIVVVDDYVDTTPRGRERSPHWQKCLLLEHEAVRRYDQVAYIDSDILINYHTAPCVVGHHLSTATGGQIGAVTLAASEKPNAERFENGMKRVWKYNGLKEVRETEQPSFKRFFELAGYPLEREDSINTGLLVLDTKADTEVMRHIYETGHENLYSGKEQAAIAHHLLANDLVNPLDSRFNKIWDTTMVEVYPFLSMKEFRGNQQLAMLCVNTAFHNAYFLHFIGGSTREFERLVVRDHHWFDAWREIHRRCAESQRVA